ncbi:hypothetical protein PENSOL_c029G11745 [Penicillium solitum]|uniref:Uncharacterized protein n=1 Tax=Penicillium solitum TaxID=60172 RepID=A0A1V6QXN1_9EURO|nr:uncharacterized protein PENSOL_c029G11745 [Penicillium solitum]OQD93953.1 hypothetical protein PENSOL_c029G11745 [Penicillium solitum]
MSYSKSHKMDPSNVEVNLTVGEDRVAHIEIKLAFPPVPPPPPAEDHSDTDPVTASNSTGVKRKRETTPESEQASSLIDTVYTESSPSLGESPLSRLGTEEIDDKREPTPGVMAPLDPQELPDLPPITTPNSRVWESHRPSNFNFTIYEDPEGQETPHVSPLQEGFHGIEEDKENIFLTGSDYANSDGEEEDTRPNLPGREASIGLLDAFGLPLNREMSDFVRPATNPIHERHMRRGREVLQTLWFDEPQVREEHNGRLRNDSLTDTHVQQLEQVEESIQRGRTRLRSDRHPALREGAPVQDPATFDNVRRVLDFQQPETSRPATPELNEGRRFITPEESEEPQQRQREQEQDQ